MRALILSDIHGNLEALQAVLAAAPAYDAIWNLGDVVGYGASPNEVVDVMRLLADASVRGNHDKVCCGTTSANAFNASARTAAEWTRKQLLPFAAAWLQTLPQGPLHPPNSASMIAHGSPLGEDVYILSIREAWVPLQQSSHRTTWFGHTHIQGGFQLLAKDWRTIRPETSGTRYPSQRTFQLRDDSTRYLLNPGSVGQPRDGDWRAAFALLDEEAGSVTFHRVPYDLSLAQGRILMAGLPERLAQRLREGR